MRSARILYVAFEHFCLCFRPLQMFGTAYDIKLQGQRKKRQVKTTTHETCNSQCHTASCVSKEIHVYGQNRFEPFCSTDGCTKTSRATFTTNEYFSAYRNGPIQEEGDPTDPLEPKFPPLIGYELNEGIQQLGFTRSFWFFFMPSPPFEQGSGHSFQSLPSETELYPTDKKCMRIKTTCLCFAAD